MSELIYSDQELQDRNIQYFIQSIRTGTPGIIVSTDGKMATVQPLVNKLFKGIERKPAVLTNVPVWRLGTQAARVSVPLNPKGGDYCIINFCERPIDTWVSGDGTAKAPKDGSTHDSRGAWILVGLEPFQEDAVDLENLVLEMNRGTDKECKVTMKPDGGIEVKSPLSVLIDSPEASFTGNVAIAGTLDVDQDITGATNITAGADIIDAIGAMSKFRMNYNGHVHVGNLGNATSTSNLPDAG